MALGKRWVVDMDLEQFFDRVKYDIPMSCVAPRIGDKQVLSLIRRYLEARIMVSGVARVSAEGMVAGQAVATSGRKVTEWSG